METRKGTEESSRGLREISKSTRRVNEAKQKGKNDFVEEREKGKEREKQTQGFRECGEIGVGERKGGDLRDGGELPWDGGGEHRKWGLQGNGER